MKASFRWLRELVPQLPNDPAAVAARFTGAGLEVEGIARFGAGAESCLVVRVVSMRPHPSRPQLRLVTVDRGGGGGPLEIVCGAPNVPDPGGLVVLAPLGTHLPAVNMTIEPRPIGGVVSEGMLCSEVELGIGEDSGGIWILPAGIAEPGTRLVDACPSVQDTIFEISLTPNRPDCLGHLGLAREAAALFEVPFKPELETGAFATEKVVRVEERVTVVIEDGERCPHYAAAAVLGVKIGPSPDAIRHRLASLGVRPISNAVDVTNLVMLEFGHPMHAFDLAKVRGRRIVVRRAVEGEPLKTLDGVARTLSSDDLVIGDGEGPTALAGVMGGGDSEIGPATTDVLLECAYFDPRTVRRSARRHGLHTESSHRFERGVDPGDTRDAIARARALTAHLTGGAAVEGTLLVTGKDLAARTVRLRPARVEHLLGVPVPRDEALAVLARLGFEKLASEPDHDELRVPTHRPDVSREVDLIEEVARVRGFDRIAPTLPAVRPTRDAGARERLVARVREAAVGLGLSEAITYAFVSPAELSAVRAPAAAVTLANPLSENHSVLRTSLLPGLLASLGRARRHGERDARLFTVGTVYLTANQGGPLPEERLGFAAVLAGDRPVHLAKPERLDAWDAKGLATSLVQRLTRRSADVRAAGDSLAHLHPRGAAEVLLGGAVVGRVGPLHPDVLDALDLDEGAMVVEIDLAALDAIGTLAPKFKAIPRFPASTRDVALVVSDDVPAGDVEGAVREAAGALAERVELFDRFVGGQVPADHSSLAFHVVYRAGDRTLTDAEVDAQHAKVVEAVKRRFGATLRA